MADERRDEDEQHPGRPEQGDAGAPDPLVGTPGDEAAGAADAGTAAGPAGADAAGGAPEGGRRIPTMDEVAAAAGAPAPSPYNSALLELKPGDVVTGTVVQVNDNEVLVDVGYKSEGIIPISELARRYVEKASDVVSVGDEIRVTVLRVDEREEGRLILSKKRADEVGAWDRLEEAYEKREVLEVPVIDAVKGGLIADVGVRGFIPASQVGQEFIRDLTPYVGRTLRVRIIELDRADRRVILSEKVVLDEEQQKKREETWARVQEGQVWTGVVKRITDFGAFVDIGGVDGLLHISEMAWGRIGHPSEILKEGQTIDVKILRVDRERQRISLGYKQLQPDPWANLATRYPPGSLVTGRVVRLVNFGAFVELEPGMDGLIHISQLADRRVASPDEVVKVGDEVTVKVLAVNPRERRISLSLREAQETRREPERREERGGRRNRRDRDRDRDRDRGTREYYGGAEIGTGVGGAVTIGDLMGDVLKNARTEPDAAEARPAPPPAPHPAPAGPAPGAPAAEPAAGDAPEGRAAEPKEAAPEDDRPKA